MLLLFSGSVMSSSLRPHGLQNTMSPCPSPSPGVCSNSCPLSHWCHPTILSSVIPFPSCLQSFPASGSFPVSQLFSSGGQRIRASASASVLPVNSQDWFPLGFTGLISLLPRDSQDSSPAPQFKSINSLMLSLLYGPTLTSVHDYWKNHSSDYKVSGGQQRDSAIQTHASILPQDPFSPRLPSYPCCHKTLSRVPCDVH